MGRRGVMRPATLAAAGVALGLVGNMATNTVEVDAWWWQPLTWGLTGLLGLVVVTGALGGRKVAELTPVEPALAELRKMVNDQWRNEANRVLGLGLDPMPVRWHLRDEARFIDGPRIGGEITWSGSGDQIKGLADRFRASGRRLVVLGGPGAGKTTLAIQLVRELLKSTDGSVPVLLTMSGWDVKEYPLFEDWLVDRLQQTYPALLTHGADMPRRLFREDRIVPVLDGLDEMPASSLPRALAELNQALPAETQLVLTSRTAEYTAASQALGRAAVVEAEPMSALTIRRPPPGPVVMVLVLVASVAWGGVLATLALDGFTWWFLVAGLGIITACRERSGDSSWVRDRPGYADLRIGQRIFPLLNQLLSGFSIASGIALASALVGGVVQAVLNLVTGDALTEGLVGSFVAAVVFGPGMLLVFMTDAVAEWAESPVVDGQASTPLTSWRADRRLNLVRLLAGGALGAIIGGVLIWATSGSVGETAVATTVAALAGMTYGLVSGRHHAWLVYELAAFRLARRGRLPRRLMAFLDDAHRLGLLRAVGPLYQFRHAEFHDHLAGRETPVTPPPPPGRPSRPGRPCPASPVGWSPPCPCVRSRPLRRSGVSRSARTAPAWPGPARARPRWRT
ncbi:NACHT domain-containing protein [Nonomuraea sp. NPDC005650]|uniref:NACHT domain-containing protein n=1 Tax=Nonomuraea sp. NPDC005650 TaxID=3157045 RepID=UPI0033AEA2C5